LTPYGKQRTRKKRKENRIAFVTKRFCEKDKKMQRKEKNTFGPPVYGATVQESKMTKLTREIKREQIKTRVCPSFFAQAMLSKSQKEESSKKEGKRKAW